MAVARCLVYIALAVLGLLAIIGSYVVFKAVRARVQHFSSNRKARKFFNHQDHGSNLMKKNGRPGTPKPSFVETALDESDCNNENEKKPDYCSV